MRIIISVVSALVVTAGLLFLMSLLIKDDKPTAVDEPPVVTIDTVTLPKEEPIPEPAKVEPPKPPAIEPTPEPSGEVIETSEIDSVIEEWSSVDPEVETSLPRGFGKLPQMAFTQESEAMPLYRTQPNYPVSAQQKGLEGWVLLKYDVDTSGTLSNIAVLNSEPKRIFDREAIRALKKWKFKPAMTNGQPISSAGQTVKIEFNMDQD
ncbi:energy transducer TonB [Kangiella spongicola]|uniref:Protein TonB n=2 Tax=Kangiella spongicola TaxID=796379 RepID=A0A318D943_9GAMM|nr:energy transducer TonB [Kangiella spongicola]